MRKTNSFAYFLAVSGALLGVTLNSTFASDLSDLEAAREKATNDYMSALITQKATTPAAQAALRHEIVDPVTAAYKDFYAHKLGSGPRGPMAPIKVSVGGARRLSSNSNSSQSFHGISPSAPSGNGESRPAPHENFVLDGSKIPKELSFGKEKANPVKKAANAVSSKSSSNRSVAGSTSSGPSVSPMNMKQFNETSDLMKLDKFSAPVRGQ